MLWRRVLESEWIPGWIKLDTDVGKRWSMMSREIERRDETFVGVSFFQSEGSAEGLPGICFCRSTLVK